MVPSGEITSLAGNKIPADEESRRKFRDATNDFAQSPAITARELAMLEAMEAKTEKRNWHVDVFNNETTEMWGVQARKQERLIGKKAWAWCLAELRDKAVAYTRQRFVEVLDAGSLVCKSDERVKKLTSETLRLELAHLFQGYSYDKGPVYDVVDPEMYPLVYGETLVLGPDQRISLSEFRSSDYSSQNRSEDLSDAPVAEINHKSDMQRLPCEVKFVRQGSPDVRITSPINNLHPCHHRIYEAVEEILIASIPMWNACLIKGPGTESENQDLHHQTQQGRVPLRIVTYGVSWTWQPDWTQVCRNEYVYKKVKAYNWAKQMVETQPKKILKVFGRRLSPQGIIALWGWVEKLPPMPEHIAQSPAEHLELAWKHPQPGVSFTYEDWKHGRDVHRPIVKMIAQHSKDEPILEGPTHTRYNVELENSFREKGLQVIVRVGGIHVPHGIKRFWDSKWDLQDNPHEHIVASSMYVYDIENATASITFRQHTPMPHTVYRYENGSGPAVCCTDDPSEFRFRNGGCCNEIDALAHTFGFDSGCDLDGCLNQTTSRHQYLGSIKLQKGRLLTFPNTVETQIHIEQTKGETGHLRYVMIYLVDPHRRISSTANVPPQQHGWWEHTYADLLLRRGLPTELVDQIVPHSHHTMTHETAERYKEKMNDMNNRNRARRHWKAGDYYF